LRSLGADYGVAHTTLGRYFARKEVAKQVRDMRRVEERAAKERRAAERRVEREIRKKAKAEAVRARSFRENDVEAPRARRSGYEAWLDERDRARPWLRADLRTKSDELAADAVANGGGIGAVIEATGLRTLDNVARRIDPAILVGAFDNDAVVRALAPRDHLRLRQLSPDASLLQRRASGEPLRRLAADYAVSHTTLSRWFARPRVARQLHELRRRSSLGVRKASA
jgi:hypothetical protein